MISPTSQPQVVVAGHICLDVIPAFNESGGDLNSILIPGKLIQVGAPVVSTGGAVPNTGLALHRLGIPTRLIGKVGKDLFGDAILSILRQSSEALVERMMVVDGEPSSYTIVVNPPGVDRVFLHCPGANDTFHPAELSIDDVKNTRFLHFGYPPLMAQTYADDGIGLSELFRKARAFGVSVSLDMAKPDPDSPAGRYNWLNWFQQVLPEVDIFAPSFDELYFMLDRPQYEKLLRSAGPENFVSAINTRVLAETSKRLIDMGAAIVALKLGSEGLYLRTTKNEERLRRIIGDRAERWIGRELLSPCMSVDVAGTTGAGDCTIAGLLAGIVHGLGPEESLVSAVAVGACSVEQADAASGIPTWEKVQDRIRKGWSRRSPGITLQYFRPSEESIWLGPNDQG